MIFPRTHCRKDQTSRGLTLLELLVVVFILTLLVAAAIPLVRPAMAEAGLKEGSRSLSIMLGVARARAQETGRPYGIRVEPSPSNAGISYKVFYAQQQPPFAGGLLNSRLRLEATAVDVATVTFNDASDATLFSNLVKIGDEFRLDFKGHIYRIDDISGTSLTISSSSTNAVPDTNGQFVPFQFYRQPSKAAGTPIQMPSGVIIDMVNSGLGDNVFTANGKPLTFTFGPNGLPDRLYQEGSGYNGLSVNDNVYFMIGKADQLGAGNLGAYESIWVAVVGQTGLIVSAENATGAIPQARSYARSGQSMGGG